MRRVRRRAEIMMAAREAEGKQALAEEGGQWRWMAMVGIWGRGGGAVRMRSGFGSWRKGRLSGKLGKGENNALRR